MRLLFLTSGPRVPSSRFRVLQYLPGLAAAGWSCTVRASRPAKYDGLPVIGFRGAQSVRRWFRGLDLAAARRERYDAIVLERELLSGVDDTALEEQFRAATPALVLDIDDGLHVTAPEKFRRLVRMSDLVLAGNATIAAAAQKVGGRGRVVVLPTVVDTQRYRAEPATERRPVVVGWTGLASNYRELAPLVPVLRRAAAETPFELQLIAERRPRPTELDLTGLDWRWFPWSEADEIERLARFDLGLMPLADTPWNRAKCGLKAIQYQALGRPCVASPVGVNQELIDDGASGFLPSDDEGWFAAVTVLVRNADLREAMGEAGRERIERTYSLEAQSPRWIDAVRSAAAAGRARAIGQSRDGAASADGTSSREAFP
jgi:glycosyltransferase involved in cell wall biosynthesis